MTARVVATHIWPSDRDTPLTVDDLVLDWGGPIGDRHHGETMAAGPRQKSVYPRGTQIRNHRQLSLIDEDELARIAIAMHVPSIAPGLIADNICTHGIPELTSLPRMTRMVFSSGAVVMLGGENFPCTIAGTLIGTVHGTSPSSFPKAGMGKRGVTGWVERPGTIRAGDEITLVIP